MQRHPTLRSPSVPDRGPAQHFHGRRAILSDFGEVLDWALQTKGGTTFLIQGAPGAGKTALLDQCEKLSRQVTWQVATINTAALHDPESLLDCLGKESRLAFDKVSGELGVDLVVKAGVTADLKRPGRTINKILRSQSKPLLLVLDEAQRLGQGEIVPAQHKGTVSDVLDYIHNGRAGTPVMLLAAGLGRTEHAFADLGVSRFRGGAFTDLGSLSEEAERAVIRDWIEKDGGAKKAPAPWVEAIMQETHGWPHHIVSYAYPASRQLRATGGVGTAEGLQITLESGRESRRIYYDRRAREFGEVERCALARAFLDTPSGGSRTRQEIEAVLMQEFTEEQATALFDSAWGKGLLDQRRGRYIIPVPSMQDWLISNYGREQIQLPEPDQVRHRNPGVDFGGR